MQKHLKFINLLHFVFPLLAIFLSLETNAKPALPGVKITRLQSNGQSADLNWKNRISPLWETNAEGGMEFFWLINVAVPNATEISSIQTDQAIVGLNDKKKGIKGKNTAAEENTESGISFKMTSLKHTFIVEYKNGKSLQFMIELVIPRPLQVGEKCDQNFLKITSASAEGTSSKPAAIPGYLVYKCEKTESGIILAVTVPNETTWVSNSIFETKGKGQRWKNFELNPQSPVGKKDTVGEFTFENNGKKYSYSVVVEKVEPKGKIARFRLSLGVANISITTTAAQVATTKPAAHVSFEVRPFAPEFSIGGTGLTTIPLSSGTFFSHSESVGYFGWTFGHKTNLSFEPRIYIYMGEGISQQISYFYKLNSPAAGGSVRYLFGGDKSFETELLFMQQAQSAITSLRLYFNKTTSAANNNTANWANWGIAAIFQKVDVTSETNAKDATTQIYLGPSLDF